MGNRASNKKKTQIKDQLIIQRILQYVHVTDLFNTQLVCWRWYEISTSNHVWEAMIRKKLLGVLGDRSRVGPDQLIGSIDKLFYRTLYRQLFPHDYLLHLSHHLVFASLPLFINRGYGQDTEMFYQTVQKVPGMSMEEISKLKRADLLFFNDDMFENNYQILYDSPNAYYEQDEKRALLNVPRSCVYPAPTLDQDTKVITIVQDQHKFHYGRYGNDNRDVIVDSIRKQTTFLIPNENNQYTKAVVVRYIEANYDRPSRGYFDDNEGGIEMVGEVSLLNYDLGQPGKEKKRYREEKKEEENDEEDDQKEGYGFTPEKTTLKVFGIVSNIFNQDPDGQDKSPYTNNCTIGSGDEETDIGIDVGSREFYVSREKIQQIESFCNGSLLGKTQRDLVFLLQNTEYVELLQEFDFNSISLDQDTMYKLGDIKFFLEYSQRNPLQIQFISFNMEIKFRMVIQMKRVCFFCSDICHVDNYNPDCPMKNCEESVQGRESLYNAFVQIYFYKFVSKYYREMENPGFQHYMFDTEFSIPYCTNTNSNTPDKMVYFKITFGSQDPLPDRDHYGDDPFFYFEFKIEYSMVDINDAKPRSQHSFSTLYIRDQDKNKPQANESFMDGVRESFENVFPNFKFDIILLLKAFKLDLYFIFAFQTNKKVYKSSPFLQLRIYASYKSLFEFECDSGLGLMTNIYCAIDEEDWNCKDDPKYLSSRCNC
ncbi:hypothetical protein CYY_008112 [Polysphondylium violaceum]|uniref:F-box domain-containing protein n=1 Tax=Polysphondylium violaceum TaxID=133409 RepID=A0A8J4PPC0_9MYCE|nr:hypothetical protein CYY_008112 [Polysphondylium violaceum]